MLIVQTQDGAIFEGDTAAAVVSRMRRDNWNAPARKLEYMEDVAERVGQADGGNVRTDDPRNFLEDLAHAGLLTVFVPLNVSAEVLAVVCDAVRFAAAGKFLHDEALDVFLRAAEPGLIEAGRMSPERGMPPSPAPVTEGVAEA